ncbi:hypothetical protein HMN09_00313800 [Mycena chlorophos]|uniref:Uncharacterized protein n=1 Tax=Mycena chlorophos TaxID=658473 RepID=A0A8H6WIE7_MYCCL|nr:hypothetical protein HMN09_00313800 [Mycena chlorophos]
MFFVARTLLLSAVAFNYVSAVPTPATITVLAPIPEGTVTASILGVDKAGHTTYAIAEPLVEGLSNGLSSTITTFTATLVAGSDYASETFSATYSDPDFQIGFNDGGECTISGSNAICNDGTSTITTDAALVTANLTQVMDVVGPTPTASGAGRSAALCMSAVSIGAAFALFGSVL